uniref:LOW QUALITY PROTEIN: TBC1 domain family member 15-like n=1 Tax=Fragaria vesca subsp. vesca TaxID=101020 RepID=UPI0005C9ECBE|nr:PREDICTED: LOW QUALITY PROTEIN: TBC1 domain family member 15-like [Fragaria vesca subsp. vesca]
MHEPELQDLADDADYAASQQHGSARSMMRSDNGRHSSSSEHDVGAEVVYVKDNVTIQPSMLATSERISGRLRLIKQGSSLSMTWIPYKGQNTTNARVSEKDKFLYAIRGVPLTEVRSIRRHTPPLGWQYIIVVLATGLAFPPLYFYNGGVKEFLATLNHHVFIERTAEDANVFLVNDFQNPLQKTLFIDVQNDNTISQHNERQKQKDHDIPARDISIQVLEKFSLVTKFARETTSQLFRDSHSTNGYGGIQRRSNSLSSIDHSSSQNKASDDSNKVSDESPVPQDPLEFDKNSLVWGKPRHPPLETDEWHTFLDSEGRIMDSEALRKRIFYGGVEHKLRKEVRPFLLGYHAYDSTYAEREYLKATKKAEFETVKKQWQGIPPEQATGFKEFQERKGLIDKDVVRTDRSISFYDGDDNPNVNLLHDILLTYSFYNFNLGYCQGMSDLLSPILFVLGDESESFWCFVKLMERLGPNFNLDQNGMHFQLFAITKLVEMLDKPLHSYFTQRDCLNYFFCFRWVLIQFKREFEFDKTLRLWEVLWTHYPSEHLHLYVCVAILKRYGSKIIGEQMDFDTLLKFINELSGQINLDAVVRDAEALCICAGENGDACIPPETPPSLPVDDGLLYPQQEVDEVL